MQMGDWEFTSVSLRNGNVFFWGHKWEFKNKLFKMCIDAENAF